MKLANKLLFRVFTKHIIIKKAQENEYVKLYFSFALTLSFVYAYAYN